LKDAKLVVRAHRENGVSIGEKIADDIYIMFQFLEGANNMSEALQITLLQDKIINNQDVRTYLHKMHAKIQ
jgi:hypothetical protein